MNIHLGFWIVRTAIALAIISIAVSYYTKLPDGRKKSVLAVALAFIMFWGAYSLVALVR